MVPARTGSRRTRRRTRSSTGQTLTIDEGYLAFRRRALQRTAELASLELIDADGVLGAVGPDLVPRGGVVLLQEVGGPLLRQLLDTYTPQWIGVLPAAEPLLPPIAAAGWDLAYAHRMMSLPDLGDLRSVALPAGVEVHRVAVRGGETGYPLMEALRVELENIRGDDAAPARDLALEARMLRTLSGIHFFAATGPSGTCIGTAGSRVIEDSALVAAVVTVPEFRRRGLGTAMTFHSLLAARSAGAGSAFLDATPAGAGIYRRLGFRDLGPILYCERSTPRRPPETSGGQ
jgi:GNAT superfamily N-acetyltransferase